MEFSERLKRTRQSKNLTQKQLAKKLGVSRPTITQYESGARKPDNDMLMSIADELNVSVDYLLGRSDIKEPAEYLKSLVDDPEIKELLEEFKNDPEREFTFKELRKADNETLKQLLQIIKTFEKGNN